MYIPRRQIPSTSTSHAQKVDGQAYQSQRNPMTFVAKYGLRLGTPGRNNVQSVVLVVRLWRLVTIRKRITPITSTNLNRFQGVLLFPEVYLQGQIFPSRNQRQPLQQLQWAWGAERKLWASAMYNGLPCDILLGCCWVFYRRCRPTFEGGRVATFSLPKRWDISLVHPIDIQPIET